ncbi:MAG: DUF2254 domain-containing protein [Candidatus Saccharimonadales bacterium]
MLTTLWAKLITYLERAQSNLWFIPSLMVFASVLLSFALLALDHRYPSQDFSWLFSGSPSAARSLLSTIAGAVITVISIAFSLTIVALQQASVQFSPRVMRNFTNDKGNQLVLGTYISTFLYSLLILRGVRDPADSSEVGFTPAIATTVALAFAVVCVALLIYFISHVANSLQAITIIHRVHSELDEQIDKLYPEPFSKDTRPVRQPSARGQSDKDKISVSAPKAGFIVRIDEDSFRELNFSKSSRLYVLPSVGEFVIRGQTLAYVHGYTKLTDERKDCILAAIIIGAQRSIKQDPLFAIRQLVDIALKALSPGINDPTTASFCIYYLGDAMGSLAQRTIPSPVRSIQDSKAYVHFNKPNWSDFIEASFFEIQYEARTNPEVTKVLLETLCRLIDLLPSRDHANALKPLLKTAHEHLAATSFDKLHRQQLQAILTEADATLSRIVKTK